MMSRVLSTPRGMGDTNPQALTSYATALQESQTPQAEWPYLWLFPPAHSRHVLYQATVTIPTYTPGTPTTAVVPLQSNTGAQTAYQVPDGMRFALRGFVIDGDGVQSWNQGSQDLLFTLIVVSAGPRAVDYLANLTTAFGSFTQGPFPIEGRLEFESLDKLQWSLTVTNNVVAGGLVIFGLMGHLYPTSEAYG